MGGAWYTFCCCCCGFLDILAFVAGCCPYVAKEPTEVPGRVPEIGGAFSPARLDLAAASDRELIILNIDNMFLSYLRIHLLKKGGAKISGNV
jgi:hypothetical protein